MDNEREELQGVIREVADPMVVMRRIVDQALATIPAAEGAVVELAHGGELGYVCTAGSLAPYVGTRLRLANSLSGQAIESGDTLYCEDSEADDRVDRDACRRVGAISMVCVPLRRRGEPVGVLKVSASRPRAFQEDDVRTLTQLAEFTSTAIGAAADMARITGDLQLSDSGAVSEFVANVLRPGTVAGVEVRHRIERVLADSDFTIVCQPIVDLCRRELVGAEALARFPGPPSQGPDVWFAEAQQAERGTELELAAARKAVALLPDLPEGAYLTVNVGPETITMPELTVMLESAEISRIVLELTEHVKVDDYDRLRGALLEIRAAGARLAIDDTGAGFASLAHILKLAPDIIKLDRDLTGGIDFDPVRRSLAAALVNFATETGAKVVAEGIETADELNTVRELGITYGQGYLLGRPAPAAALPRPLDYASLLAPNETEQPG